MKLIIGKNSQIISKIKNDLINCDFISHKDLSSIGCYSNYTNIFIFSWSHSSLNENIDLYESLPAKKTIFISSSAVFSIQKRHQWNRYPNWKKALEEIALERGSKILRIGVWDKYLYQKMSGFIPYTSKKQLVELINNIENNDSKVMNCFNIKKGNLNGAGLFLSNILNNISDILPSSFIFQAPLEIVHKLFRLKSYGYTRDSNYFFSNKLLIGDGCFGNAYKKINIIDRVLTSDRQDILLSSNGFVDTILGYKNNGLGKYWHGAYIDKIKSQLIKKVPLIVSRPRPGKNNHSLHVDTIDIHKNFLSASGKHGNINTTFFSNKVILASGSIENCKLIAKFSNKNTFFFDDHELINFGTISLKNAVLENFLKLFFFNIIAPQYQKKLKLSGYKILVEARPFNDIKSRKNIYATTTNNIIFKILKRFSFLSLNEAFFNKFRISFKTKKVVICGQVLVKNCIEYDTKKNKLIRHRIPLKDFNLINDEFKKIFPSFKSIKFNSFDGQHIFGGSDAIESYQIKTLIDSGRIKILGSPSKDNLDVYHHTQSIINKIKYHEKE